MKSSGTRESDATHGSARRSVRPEPAKPEEETGWEARPVHARMVPFAQRWKAPPRARSSVWSQAVDATSATFSEGELTAVGRPL